MKYWSYLLLLFIALPLSSLAESSVKDHWISQPISIEFRNETLRNVLGKISTQTNVAIMYDQELQDNLVSGSYNGVALKDVINRLFARQNKTLVFNAQEKIIIVKFFGAKEYIWAANTRRQLPFSGGMTADQLAKLHKAQYKEYKASLGNEKAILENGMTRDELTAMQAEQYQLYKDDAPNESFLEHDMTVEKLKALHSRQYEAFKKSAADDNEVLENGMTRGILREMQERQYKDYKKEALDDNELLENGMSRKDLREMHYQQYEEYKQNQNNVTN